MCTARLLLLMLIQSRPCNRDPDAVPADLLGAIKIDELFDPASNPGPGQL